MTEELMEYLFDGERRLMTRSELRRAWITDQARRLEAEIVEDRHGVEDIIADESDPAKARSYKEAFNLVETQMEILDLWAEFDADIQRIAQAESLSTTEVIKAALGALKQGYQAKEDAPMMGPDGVHTAG